MSELGERIGIDALRFVRRFNAPAERVWQALTTPEGIAAWLGRPIALDAFADGAFDIELSAEDQMDGRILEFEPPHRLAIVWHETSNGVSSPYGTGPRDTSLIVFELSPDDAGGTMLVFTHRHIRDGETLSSFGAGWHAHLEVLGAYLSAQPPIDLGARYAALKPLYDARLTTSV